MTNLKVYKAEIGNYVCVKLTGLKGDEFANTMAHSFGIVAKADAIRAEQRAKGKTEALSIAFLFEDCECDEQVVIDNEDFGPVYCVLMYKCRLNLSLSLTPQTLGLPPWLNAFESEGRFESTKHMVYVRDILSDIKLKGAFNVHTAVNKRLLSYKARVEDPLWNDPSPPALVYDYRSKYNDLMYTVQDGVTIFRTKLRMVQAGYKKWAVI